MLELAAGRGVGDSLVARQAVGGAPDVPCAAFVGAGVERVQPRVRPAHVSGHERQTGEGADAVVPQVGRDRLEAVEGRARVGAGEQPRRLAYPLLGDTRRCRDPDQVELPEAVAQLLRAVAMVGQEIVVVQRLVDDDADHAADQRRLAARDRA